MIDPNNVGVSTHVDEACRPVYTRFIINAGYAESSRASCLELVHSTGFNDVQEAMKHLVKALEKAATYCGRSQYSSWRDAESTFLNLHIEEMDIINGDSVSEVMEQEGWYGSWSYSENYFYESQDIEAVQVQNFLRLIDNEGAYIQWQVGKIDTNSYSEREKRKRAT